MAIKKCKPNNSVKFLKKGYTNQDFIDEYKKLLDEWKKFSDYKDDLWHTTMKNDKRCMQLDFKVWYLEWQNESLKKKLHNISIGKKTMESILTCYFERKNSKSYL